VRGGAKAAGRQSVSERAGARVELPDGWACCGRPLYDYGMLDLARRYLRRTLDVLRDELRAGTPIVGIEPSCVAVFRDELPNLFPDDRDARVLSRSVHHFAELLAERDVPRLGRRALLWGHCHQKATGGLAPDRAVLERMGVEVEEVTGGCCGLAGSWGFEAAHYELSKRIGEHALLPRVRAAPDDTLIVANGFSCKTQVEQLTNRRALHLAEVLRLGERSE
jgi:Fe-S oxidoreductase